MTVRAGMCLVVLLTSSLLFVACDSLTGGDKKVVVNEQVCGSVSFLNLKLGEKTKIVLDNSVHSDEQYSLGLMLREFPIILDEFREGAQVGPTFTTVQLFALAGDEDEITVTPTFTGQYTANCQIVIDRGSGSSSVQQDLRFQIVE